MERVSDRGIVSGRLHVRSLRKDDMIPQVHLHEVFLKSQGSSTFAIVNPECPIRRDKVTNHLRVSGIQYRATSDSYLML